MKIIPTKPCPWCSKTGEVQATDEQYSQWCYWVAASGKLFIQDVMPTLSADDREQIMTGFHEACWDDMMAEAE